MSSTHEFKPGHTAVIARPQPDSGHTAKTKVTVERVDLLSRYADKGIPYDVQVRLPNGELTIVRSWDLDPL